MDWPLAAVVLGVVGALAKLWHDWIVSHKVSRVEQSQTSDRSTVTHVEQRVDSLERQIDQRMGRVEKQLDALMSRIMDLCKE